MSLDPATVLALALRCAPGVAADTLLAVAQAESGLNPYAVGINRAAPLARPPQSRSEALAIARRRLASGANLDLGLAQVNSANLSRLGLTLEDALDPCRNLTAAGQVLTEDYGLAQRPRLAPQAALRVALSLYNTGDKSRGFRNGYVARVVAGVARKAPSTGANPRTADARPAWDAFGEFGGASFVVTASSVPGATP